MPTLTLYRLDATKSVNGRVIRSEVFMKEGFRSLYTPNRRQQTLLDVQHLPDKALPVIVYHFVGEGGKSPEVAKFTHTALSRLDWRATPEDNVPNALKHDKGIGSHGKGDKIAWYIAKVESSKLNLLPDITGMEGSPSSTVPDRN